MILCMVVYVTNEIQMKFFKIDFKMSMCECQLLMQHLSDSAVEEVLES